MRMYHRHYEATRGTVRGRTRRACYATLVQRERLVEGEVEESPRALVTHLAPSTILPDGIGHWVAEGAQCPPPRYGTIAFALSLSLSLLRRVTAAQAVTSLVPAILGVIWLGSHRHSRGFDQRVSALLALTSLRRSRSALSVTGGSKPPPGLTLLAPLAHLCHAPLHAARAAPAHARAPMPSGLVTP